LRGNFNRNITEFLEKDKSIARNRLGRRDQQRAIQSKQRCSRKGRRERGFPKNPDKEEGKENQSDPSDKLKTKSK